MRIITKKAEKKLLKRGIRIGFEILIEKFESRPEKYIDKEKFVEMLKKILEIRDSNQVIKT